MLIYTSYSHLTESNLFDKIICSYIKSRWSLFILFVLGSFQGIIPSIICFSSLLLRTTIDSITTRRIIAWLTILWSSNNGLWIWTMLLIFNELFRELLRYGVPHLLKSVSNNIPTDPPSETLIRRLFCLAGIVRQQCISLNIKHITRLIESYQRGDIQESFTPEERQNFKRFFEEFDQTSFIIDQEQYSITIFFPTLMVRFSHNGIQHTSDGEIKLIRIDQTEDNCPICHQTFSDFIIELKCHHRFCHSCIFKWLDQQFNCPMCRHIIT